MKKITLTAITGLFTLVTAGSLFAQTQAQRASITQRYDVAKLEQLSESFSSQAAQKKKAALQMAAANGWKTFITNPNGSVDELMDVSPDGLPIYYTIENVDAAKSTRANHLNIGGSLGLNLDGQNMVAYVWDGGATRVTHQEFDGPGGNNRVSIVDGATSLNSNSFHAQHVTGTIVASGFVANAKGMAPQAQARTADWNNDLSEATTQAANGMLLSNHSYGYRASSLPDWYFGAYIAESRDWDQLMHNSPFYLMVVAAGNDGNDNSSNGAPLNGNSSYDKLSGHSTAKNNLVVANGQDANVNADGSLNSVVINGSSSEGPTDDLRIKPDITGNGTGVYSTDSGNNSDYTTLTGTSMASPNVTGSLLLLQQHFNNLTGVFMRAATLKGLALHTADDAGITGPDAVYGWGLMNTKAAAEVLSAKDNGAIVDELTLSAGQTYTITVNADGTSPLMASISWTDLPGTANNGTTNLSTPVLVNDLDIRVTKNSTTYFPYKLTGVNSNTQGDNNVDPYERIAVNNATGSYTVTVTHKGSLTGGSQDFSLIVTGISSEPIVCNADVPANLAVGSVETTTASLSWDAVPAATYDVRYRPTGGTWSTLGVNTNSVSISGLAPETQYEAQVRSKCDGGENSAYSASTVFTTPEIVLNYCASEGTDASYEHIESIAIGSFSKNSGNNGGYADFTNDVITINKEEATAFTLTPGFSGSTYNETWRLFADLNKDGDFDDAGEILFTSSNTSAVVSGNITVPASAITGNTRLRVSMKYNASPTACESFRYGEVEDYTLSIQELVPEPCDAPTGLIANNPTTSSIDIAWSAVGNADGYILQHRVAGGVWSTQIVVGTSTTVGGLSDNTTYEFRVASDCGNETSAYSAMVSETTEEIPAPVCDAPVSLQSSNITTTSFTVSWSAVNNATGYVVDFRVAGGSWSTTSASTNSIDLTGGTPSTTYEVRVKTDCGSGLESAFSTIMSVTTEDEPVEVSYCVAAGGNSSREWIQSIRFGNTTYNSGNNGGYLDNTANVINMTPGGSIYVQLAPGFTSGLFWTNSYPEYWNLWIDFNQDGDFDDAGELWASTNGTSSSTVSGTVAIPSGVSGTTRMRIAMRRNTGAPTCGTFDRGEVEDYTVNFGDGTQGFNAIASTSLDPETLTGNISFGLAPNPTRNMAKLSVTTHAYQGDITIKVVDVTGRTVMHQNLREAQDIQSQQIDIDLSSADAGTYLVTVRTASGESTTQRLVKY